MNDPKQMDWNGKVSSSPLVLDESDGDGDFIPNPRGAMPQRAGSSAGSATESSLSVDEVEGTAISAGDSLGATAGETDADGNDDAEELHDGDGSESGYFEADAMGGAFESEEESALSDLLSVPGFEPRTQGESAGETSGDPFLAEAGSEVSGSPEIFGALAGLLPVLTSTLGPIVAKQAKKRLSPIARRALALAASKGTGLIGTVAKLFENAEMTAGSGAESAVDEATVAETAHVLEVIIGKDDRVRIQATTKVPWRRLCALRIEMKTGAVYRGTGFLIGKRTVATAGHCVYMHSQGGWAKRIEVIPGMNGSAKPFGSTLATSFCSVTGWVKNKKPASDYGCIVLPKGALGGHNIGSFGFASLSTPELLSRTAVLAGYPGDKPFAELWGMSRKIKAATPRQLIYDIDTVGGQSGAPVYVMHNGQRRVVGIHNYGASTGNSATRITPAVFKNLKKWSQKT